MNKYATILLVLFILVIIIIYTIFSTNIINNRWICHCKHLESKKVFDWEIESNTRKIFNPSLTKYGENYVMSARYSNKTLKNIYSYLLSKSKNISHICFILLSPNFEILKIIFPKLNNIPLEDPRIHYHNNKFYVSITEFNSDSDIFPALYILDKEFNLIKRVDYNKDNYFAHAPKNNIQKNWCIFSHYDDLLLHTDSYPIWRVMKITETGNMSQLLEHDTTDFFENYKQKIIRCSTSWKSLTESTYICGLHTKEMNMTIPTMSTILIEIDKKTLKPIRKTDIICIDSENHTKVQFLSGIEVDDMNVYLSYGIGDYKVEIIRFTKNHLLKNLLK
jgi:predicted GH43/DUF377 family glycosyl hydrolase